MKYTESLKKTPQFRNVYRRGKSVANRYLVLYKCKNNQEANRLGISVSKKVGKSVVRSRVTRLIRESYRLREDAIAHPGWDFVVVARTASNDASYEEISHALEKLLKAQQVLDH
ncbi:MAG: ribonuclease P protein component [Cellulosilyticaceae bacterium]